jgi:hypothetical protein
MERNIKSRNLRGMFRGVNDVIRILTSGKLGEE